MTLLTRIQLLLITIALLIGVTSAFFAGRQTEAALREELLARGELIGSTLNEAYVNAIANNNLLHVVDGIRRLKAKDEDIAYIYFVGFNGQVVAHTFDDGFPTDLSSVWVDEPDDETSILLSDNDNQYVEIRKTLIPGLESKVHLGLALNLINEQVNSIRARILGFALLTIVVGSLFGAFLVYRFTQPLSFLSDLFGRISRGEKVDPEAVDVRSFSKEFKELFASFFSMISEREKAQSDLSYEASHDRLTGLINRREFLSRAERLLASADDPEDSHAICVLDLNQFKVVNDTCGPAVGDKLLRELSEEMQKRVRASDTIARIGGDEFGLLLRSCSVEAAERIAGTVLTAIKGHLFVWGNETIRITGSVGLVPVLNDGKQVEELMMQADTACNLAKDLGRNRVHVYRENDYEVAQRQGEMQWVPRIHRALEVGAFCLYAQAIERADGSDHRHYELLLRLNDSNDGVVTPAMFLPAAERYNLMDSIDVWVLETALRTLAENASFLREVDFISINLSGQSLAKSGFLEFVQSLFNQYQIDFRKICFEVTETAAIANLRVAIEVISALRDRGCLFALDDFGSGLSSFTYLKNLPVDFLKIDGAFVHNMHHESLDHAMVRSINDIGHVMGMKTIAEYVENDEIKGMLKALGVDYLQGYAVGRPLPLEDLLQ